MCIRDSYERVPDDVAARPVERHRRHDEGPVDVRRRPQRDRMSTGRGTRHPVDARQLNVQPANDHFHSCNITAAAPAAARAWFLYESRARAEKNKKHLKNVGPIRHCEPPHAALPFTRCRYCRTPPAHRCPRQQRQRVTEWAR